MNSEGAPATLREALARVDEGWQAFWARVQSLPSEQLELKIGDGWTRKQMLAHVSTWHDLTTQRLSRFAESGEPQGLDEHEDVINARAARAAEGRTMGEVLQTMEESHRRLRREISRLTDAQLIAHDGFAAAIIAGNTFDHYRGHLPDLDAAPA